MIIDAQVRELGSSTDTVSSFPVIIQLNESHPELKAGMSVETSMEFDITEGDGFPIPLTALVNEGQIDVGDDPNAPLDALVYLYDAASQTVKRHTVKIGGIRENRVVVVDGLKLGDRVASAGVSFLRDGQKVKLLVDQQ